MQVLKKSLYILYSNVVYLFRIERHFDLIDKNDDQYVTLHELRDFQVAVYKKARMTPAEFRDQEWMLRNLYPRDLLGSDDKLDIEEYKAMKTGTSSTPAPFATSLKPDMFSNKPFAFWDLNKDGGISYEELHRFKH